MSFAAGTFFLVAALLPGAGAVRAEEQQRGLDSSRFMGRGGTFVAAYDSDEATRGNPATLAEPNVRFQARWLQLDVFVGENTVQTVNDVTNLASGKGEQGLVPLLEKFEDKFGQRQYARIQLSPVALRILTFEIAPFVSSSNFIDARIPTMPVATIDSDTRAGATISYAREFGKELNLGLSLKPMHRTTYHGDLAFSDIPSFVDNKNLGVGDIIRKREGFQLGWDMGAIWRPGKAWRFGMMLENIGYAGNFSTFADPPQEQAMRVSLGMDYRIDWKPWYWDVLVDLQDLANPHHYHPLRLVHLGSELGRTYVSRDTDAGFLLGLNEGYGTIGGYVDLFLARLTMSYYAVELGEYPGQRRDRRFGITAEIATTF